MGYSSFLVSHSFFLFFFFLSPFPSYSQTTYPINVWPMPTNLSRPIPKAIPLSPSFKIHSPYPHHPHLHSAVDRISRRLFSERYRPVVVPTVNYSSDSQPLHSLVLSVSDLSAPLHHGVDESYSLHIFSSTGSAYLKAATPWGAMRGLETFSQLTWGHPPVVAADIYVSDAPLFPHRGVMLDTSRNYFPVRDILRTIEAMAANKLNVFHWHITDSHSFPVVLPSVPELAEKGSYGPGMQYTASDVMKIVDYGLGHGVRVIPEIDMPGHTGSWAEAYPHIVTCANMFWLPNQSDWAGRFASEPGTGQLNPLKSQTYEVVHNVIRDVASLFPEPFFHAGGDEITPGCWKADPTIQAFLSDGGTLRQVLELFVKKTNPTVVLLNRTAVYWEDVLLDSLVKVDPSVLPTETTILQTWSNGPNNTKLIVQVGYRVIVSSADFYYLDLGHGEFLGNNSNYDTIGSDMSAWSRSFKTWQRIYDYDITYGLTEEEAKLVLGGEVALWSEQADSTVLDARLWPRTSAMAEALWSGNRDPTSGKKRYADATDRLNYWRYRMVGRGINAEPIQPLWCWSRPGMCDLVQ